MLSDEILEKVSERLVNRIENANEYILKTIGNNLDEIGKLSYTEAHKIAQIMKYGGDYDKIVKKLAEITNLNENDIKKIFNEVARSDYEFAKQFYDYNNVRYIPYDENLALKSQVEAITRITQRNIKQMMNPSVLGYGMVDNVTGQVTFKGLKQAYYDLLDEAVMSVSQGKETFNEAMQRQIKQMGGGGLKVIYDSTYVNKKGKVVNRTRRLDSSIRMNMKDGLRTLHNETQEMFGNEFGANGVEISVHTNPAEDHEEMQGRQFSNEEYNKLQLDGVAKDYTGKEIDIHRHLKDGSSAIDFRPVSQYNCYHYTFSIVLGVSKPEYSNKQLQKIIDDNNKGFELDGQHYTNYEGTQMQRKLETEIRKQKDIQIMAKASGQTDTVAEAQKKISNLTAKYKELSDKAGLPTKMDRMRVSGYKRIKVDNQVNKNDNITYKNYYDTNYYKSNEEKWIDDKPNEYSLRSKIDKVAKDENEAMRIESAVENYTNENAFYNYARINGHINSFGIENVNEDIKEKASLIQKAINGNEIQDNIKVWRVIDTNDIKIDSKGNYYIQNKGFTSTSVTEKTSVDFIDSEDKIKLEIKVPKGTNGLYIGEDTMAIVDEDEMLFGLNTKIVLEEDYKNKQLVKAKMIK